MSEIDKGRHVLNYKAYCQKVMDHVLTFRANEQARKYLWEMRLLRTSLWGRGLFDCKELWEQDPSACLALHVFYRRAWWIISSVKLFKSVRFWKFRGLFSVRYQLKMSKRRLDVDGNSSNSLSTAKRIKEELR